MVKSEGVLAGGLPLAREEAHERLYTALALSQGRDLSAQRNLFPRSIPSASSAGERLSERWPSNPEHILS